MEECDCGYCGKCAEQIEYERSLETGGWHTPPASEEIPYDSKYWPTQEKDKVNNI